ncbi:MAG: hypothetical protein GY841_08680 [FCB group bacterium]|nr:hypothetical protein [FCB group bacterium]
MSAIMGVNGKLVFNAEDGNTNQTVVTNLTSWTLDATADVAEATIFGDSWKNYKAGLNDFTVTAEALFEDGLTYGTDIPLTPTGEVDGLGSHTDPSSSGSIYLELWLGAAEANGIIYGPAICTAISFNTPVDGVAKVTYTFQGTGELQYVTTEPTYS